MLVLRDGRKLIGVLRSWDQFGTSNPTLPSYRRSAEIDLGATANLVLQDTIERIFIEDIYADISRGIFLVRGENVLLLGEIVRSIFPHLSLRISFTGMSSSKKQDLDKDDYIPEPYRKASPEEVHALTVEKNKNTRRSDKIRQAKLQALGFEAEHSGEILF